MKLSPLETFEKAKGNLSNAIIGELEKARIAFSKRSGPYLKWFPDIDPDDNALVFPSLYGDDKNTVTKSLVDFTEGLGVIAGNPNAGKSSVIISLIHGLLSQQNDVVVVDISYDDGYSYRYLQHLCFLTGLVYSEVSNYSLLSPEKKQVYDKADKHLKSIIQSETFYLFGPSLKVDTEERPITLRVDQLSHIPSLFTFLRKIHPDKKIVVFIDALNDIVFDSVANSDLTKDDMVITTLSKSCIENKLVCMLSTHLRKNKDDISIEDIKGSKTLEYATKVVYLVRNMRREGVENCPKVNINGYLIDPLILQVAKSKVSSFQTNIVFGIDSSRCRLYPVTLEDYNKVNKDFYNYLKYKTK